MAPKKDKPPVKSPDVVTEAADASAGKVLVANYHTASIILPRASKQGVAVQPLILLPGTTNIVEAEEWQVRRQNEIVLYYMDKGLIAEVKRIASDIPMTEASTSDLDSIIPDNLRDTKQVGAETGVSVDLQRANVSEVAV